MGQKTNSTIFRLGYKNNEWNSSHFNNNFEESSLYIYQDIEIKKYINHFFQQYNLLIQNCKIKRSNKILEIFISYYTTLKLVNFIHKINLDQKFVIKQRKKIFQKTKYSNTKFLQKKRRRKRLWIIKDLKEKFRQKKRIIPMDKFIDNLLESLAFFTNDRLNIVIVLQNVNKGLSLRLRNKEAQSFRKTIIKLRKYSKAIFFREYINILSLIVRKKNSSKLLAELIAFQFSVIKRHNFFLNFLKRALTLMIHSKFSKINGIKLLIKGRINGKPRSNSRIIQIGTVSLQTLDANIDFSQSTAFSLYGTFGIKVWLHEK